MENLGLILTIVQTLGGMAMTISYFPNIINFYKTKTAVNHSLPFWIILNFGLLNFVIGGAILWITTGTVSVLIPQLLNFTFAFIVLMQILYYRKRDNE